MSKMFLSLVAFHISGIVFFLQLYVIVVILEYSLCKLIHPMPILSPSADFLFIKFFRILPNSSPVILFPFCSTLSRCILPLIHILSTTGSCNVSPILLLLYQYRPHLFYSVQVFHDVISHLLSSM